MIACFHTDVFYLVDNNLFVSLIVKSRNDWASSPSHSESLVCGL